MRIIKLGALSLFFLSLVVFLISLMIPSQVRISRAINVMASKESVRVRLVNLGQWKQWNELISDRTTITMLHTSADTVITSWKGRGRPVSSSFAMEESGGTTVLQWYFDFKLKWYPWEKFGSIIFDKQFGIPMEQSLNNLKNQLENNP
ncbi:MAG: hypothetical protein ABI687_08935 [Flavitalea sp.]